MPVGGAERLIAEVVRGLDRRRYDPMVCCIQARGELAAEIEQAGIPVFCLERMKSKRFDWGAVRDLANLLRRERIDLVHTHLYHANLYGRLAAWRAGVPAIATVHNTYTRPKLHRRLINRLLSRASSRVIAVSEDIRRDLIRYDGVRPDKILTITNAIDIARIETPISRQEARQRLGIPDHVLAIGCVARLEEQKGHRFLLEALTVLKGIPLRVFFVGDGRLRQTLEEQAVSLGVAQSTTFLGTRQDVPEILKALDVYVMPSLWEGLSIAMLEAMAAALPVVISDVGGVSQVVGNDEYGIRVPPGNAAELARAIRSLCAEPQRRAALGARAKQRVLENFSLDAMLRELTKVYEEATPGR
jgi:L-malate glycosyltransferase